MKVGEMFVKLGFQTDGAKLRDFVDGIKNLDMNVIRSVAGLSGLYYALRKVMDQSVGSAMAVHNFSVQTELSGQKMQQWARLAEKMGASQEDIVSTLRALQSASASIRLGQGNIAPFQFLNVDPHQDPFSVLEDLRERLKTLDPAIARAQISQMGLSDAMLNVLKASDAEFESIKRQLFLNQEQIKALVELRKAWVNLQQQVLFFVSVLGSKLAPTFQHLGMFLEDLINVVKKLEPIKGILIVIGTVLAGIFFPVATAIGLVIFLIDEIYTKLEGGRGIFDVLGDGIKAWLDLISQFFQGLFGWIDNLFQKVESFQDIAQRLSAGMGFAGLGLVPTMQQSSSNVSNNQRTNNITIKVDGLSGPMQVADAVMQKLKEVFTETQYQAPVDNA